MQLYAAPGETLIQQMRERRCLAEVPLPAALPGKGFGEVGQIRRFVRGDHFRLDALAIVFEKRLTNCLADLLMGDAWQQLHQIRHATAHRGNPLGLQLFFVGIEIVRQTAQVSVKQ
ncbi:hypothetical protein D3C72_1702190 [compost metagenome]